MSDLKNLMGKQVCLKISGEDQFFGILTDLGQDILVLYNGEYFLYIPLLHVHRISRNNDMNSHVEKPSVSSIEEDVESISYRKMLTNAKGTFSEIYVTGNVSFHGYITSVLNDYFAFYSPVYKMMYISLNHLKWLIPYNQNTTPYTLSNEHLPVNPPNIPLLRSFEDQLQKLTGRLVVFDVGENPLKIGLLNKVNNNFVELVVASGDIVYLKINHIKSVQIP